MRIFFALWPPLETAQALTNWAAGVQRETGGKLTAADKIHLTLAFLGEADAKKATEAAQAVRAPAHALPMEQARYWRHNQIVWAGPHETPAALQGLVERLHLELTRRELIPERQPFAAHVTLIRKARAPHSLPLLPALRWPVGEILLVQSRISREGASYTPLAHFPLN